MTITINYIYNSVLSELFLSMLKFILHYIRSLKPSVRIHFLVKECDKSYLQKERFKVCLERYAWLKL